MVTRVGRRSPVRVVLLSESSPAQKLYAKKGLLSVLTTLAGRWVYRVSHRKVGHGVTHLGCQPAVQPHGIVGHTAPIAQLYFENQRAPSAYSNADPPRPNVAMDAFAYTHAPHAREHACTRDRTHAPIRTHEHARSDNTRASQHTCIHARHRNMFTTNGNKKVDSNLRPWCGAGRVAPISSSAANSAARKRHSTYYRRHSTASAAGSPIGQRANWVM